MALNQFINIGTDNVTVNNMEKSFAHEEDLQKAMNKAGLVQKEVQVKGKNGQMFTRKQWVKASDAKAPGQSKSDDKTSSGKFKPSDFQFRSGGQDVADFVNSIDKELGVKKYVNGNVGFGTISLENGASVNFGYDDTGAYATWNGSNFRDVKSLKSAMSGQNSDQGKMNHQTGVKGKKTATMIEDYFAGNHSHEDGKKALAGLLGKGYSREDIMEQAEKSGVTWKKNDHAGINWMRASMAIQKHLNSSSENATKSSPDKKVDSGEKKSSASDRVYLQHSGGTQQQGFQAAREYLESHPVSFEDAKKSVSIMKDQKKASSLFAKNSLLKGNLVMESGSGKEHKTYFGQIDDSIVQELTNNISIEDSMKVETKKGTLTVGELRPYLSEINTVLDTPYKDKAVVVQAEKGALSKKVGTITSGGNTYDIYDSASDNYGVVDNTPRYYVAVNTSAPKGLPRYRETLLRDLCSTEIAKGGQITKKQAEKALAGFGIEWDKDSLDKYESGYKATKEDSEKIASKVINPSSKSFKAEATKVYHELVLRDWMIANTGGNKQSKAGK